MEHFTSLFNFLGCVNMKNCSFTGHRIIPGSSELREKLRLEIIKLIDKGVTDFYNGGALGFDTVCALDIITLKENFDIKLHLILPCKDQDEKWTVNQRNAYSFILDNADSIEYVSEKYENGCMQVRNKLLVDKSDIIIAYCKRQSGGSYFTVKYAEKIGKEIINIAN